MSDDLRTRIAAAMRAEVAANGLDSPVEDWIPFLTDAVIRELPELKRIAKVAEVCWASLDLDSRTGTALTDRQWLAETILNVLNGNVE